MTDRLSNSGTESASAGRSDAGGQHGGTARLAAPRGLAFAVKWFLPILLAGLSSGLTMDFMRGRFDKEPPTFANPTAEQTAQYNRQRQSALRWSAAASTSSSGVVLAAFFGLALGLVGGSVWRGVAGIMCGAATAAVLAGLGGMVAQRCYAVVSVSGKSQPPMWDVLMQLTFWLPAAIAVAAAAAATIRSGQMLRVALASLAGAVVASVVVPILGTVLFLITLRSSRDVVPPDTLSHCLLMGVIGSLALGSVIVAVFGRQHSVQ